MLEKTAEAAALQGRVESEERFAFERKEMLQALLAASVENAALVAAHKSRNELLDAKAEFAAQLHEIREQLLAERLAGAPGILESHHGRRPILRKVAATGDCQTLSGQVEYLAAENAELKDQLAKLQQQLAIQRPPSDPGRVAPASAEVPQSAPATDAE